MARIVGVRRRVRQLCQAALALDPGDADAPAGTGDGGDCQPPREPRRLSLLKRPSADRPAPVHCRIALSRLLAARGDFEPGDCRGDGGVPPAPASLPAWEQLASIFSDTGDAERLDAAVGTDASARSDERRHAVLHCRSACSCAAASNRRSRRFKQAHRRRSAPRRGAQPARRHPRQPGQHGGRPGGVHHARSASIRATAPPTPTSRCSS